MGSLSKSLGGAGRSTVSTNSAGELSKSGKTVLIDCDMLQGTSVKIRMKAIEQDCTVTDIITKLLEKGVR